MEGETTLTQDSGCKISGLPGDGEFVEGKQYRTNMYLATSLQEVFLALALALALALTLALTLALALTLTLTLALALALTVTRSPATTA